MINSQHTQTHTHTHTHPDRHTALPLSLGPESYTDEFYQAFKREIITFFTFHFHALEKEMATHSSVLAWRIPWMGEPGGLPSMGSHRVGHD